MATEQLLKIHVNPLVMLEVDEPWALQLRRSPTEATLLQYATAPGIASDVPALAARYREVSDSAPQLIYAPIESRILDKLVWPLRHAKASYMLGSYLSTIALAGMIGEMVAMLTWEMSEPQLNGKPVDEEQEVALFGSRFEKLGQERRVSILKAYSMIAGPAVAAFDTIRAIRRRYLHLWSQDHDRLPTDAIACFKAATDLVIGVTGREIVDGQIRLTIELSRYLERRGSFEPAPEDTATEGAP